MSRGKLPFPVLIDKDRRTTERYGIDGHLTVALIDAEVKIVKNGNLTMLKEKLGVKG